MNEGPKQLKGRKLGDRRVRIERPHAAYFRYSPEGTLVAKEAASVPRTPAGRLFARVRGVLFGRPLSTHEEITERPGHEMYICEPDPALSSQLRTWNRSEYLSATGQNWEEAVNAKVAAKNRVLTS